MRPAPGKRLPAPGGDLPTRQQVRERGGIVLGWLTKIVVGVTVVGVLAFDGLSLVLARTGAQGNAETAVLAASESYQTQPDVHLAYSVAIESLGPTDAVIPPQSFKVYPDGTVTLRVQRTADTLVLRYFPPAEQLTKTSTKYTGRSEIS